ncbi:MAG: alpha/beta hydrolase [Firmicutes bacterium]|nr:alpha/beta hydrolase [Bacillota bacterium]
MPFVKVKETAVHYACTGRDKGTVLLFCHGSGGSSRHWAFQLEGLKNFGQVIAVDLPGHGHSEGDPADAVEVYREFLLAFCNTLGLEKTVLGGHSMGGAVVIDFALQYPERVEKLILIGTGGRLRVAPAVLETFSSGRVSPSLFSFAFGPLAEARLQEEAQRQMMETPAAVYAADFTACDRFDRLDRLPEIEAPTLIICGTEDRLTPVKYSRYLHQTIPRSQLVELEGAGHMVMLEAPEQVNRAIAVFLQEDAN